jgi:pilus assembly protein CpaB
MSVLTKLHQYRSLSMLLGALAFGALAVFGARGYISEQLSIERERLTPRQEMAEVVVAKRELQRGDVVGADTMAVRRIPKEYLPGSVVAPGRFDSYVGTRLVAAMRSGEPLVYSAMEGADISNFSSKVRQGIRAVTIAVDEMNSLSGMLQPGDRIDLQVSIRPPLKPGAPANPELTAPLMQDILVLATGRQVRPSGDENPAGRGFTSITVEVTPDQAQKLIVAQRSGKLTALLRNRDDRRPIAQRPLDIYSLLDLPQPTAPSALRGGPEIIVGGKGQIQSNFQSAAPALLTGSAAEPPAASATAQAPVPRPPAASEEIAIHPKALPAIPLPVPPVIDIR